MKKKDGNKSKNLLNGKAKEASTTFPGKELEGESLTAIIDITERKNAAKALLKAQQTLEEKVKQRTKQLEDASISLLEITEEKLKDSEKMVMLYEQLVESEKKLKEQNENKDKFFALLSHDLRTPFNGIMGFAKLLTNKIDTLSKDEIKLYASHIYTLSQNFDKLMNDLLVWCNVQMNNVVFQPGKVCICKIIEETIGIFSDNAKEKGIDIVWSCQMDYYVKADENMVKSVFRNLLSNALKFTNRGGKIVVESKCDEDFCEISIADNGIGISDRTEDKIFKINEHTGSTGTANEKGTGLGLILSKEFIEKHGGKIWFESEQGKGTTFFFTLPNFK